MDFKKLSNKAEAIVIWGGNNTIDNVISKLSNKKIKTVCFPNRSSFSAINLDWLNSIDDTQEDNGKKLFAKDLFSFGQRACSSPRVLFAAGTLDVKKEKELVRFLEYVSNEGIRMNAKGVKARDCFINAERFAMKYGKPNMVHSKNLYCPLFESIKEEIQISELYQAGCDGCLPIISSENWEDLCKCAQNDSQTLVLIGMADNQREDIYKWTKRTSITRYAKPGTALNIDIIWDGYDIVEELTRKIRYE